MLIAVLVLCVVNLVLLLAVLGYLNKLGDLVKAISRVVENLADSPFKVKYDAKPLIREMQINGLLKPEEAEKLLRDATESERENA